MHEASLMKDLMTKILTVAEGEGDQISSISVWLGALSHMSPDHFREHYEEASRNTIAENATLEIETSGDLDHENAQDILLKSIKVAS